MNARFQITNQITRLDQPIIFSGLFLVFNPGNFGNIGNPGNSSSVLAILLILFAILEISPLDRVALSSRG